MKHAWALIIAVFVMIASSNTNMNLYVIAADVAKAHHCKLLTYGKRQVGPAYWQYAFKVEGSEDNIRAVYADILTLPD